MIAEDVILGNQLHTGMRFSVVEQQTVAVHTVAARPSDQAADLPKLSCLNFNEHLTSFPVTLNKYENAIGNILLSFVRFVAQRSHYERLVSLKKRDIKLYLLLALPKRTFLTGNPARRCAVSLSAALTP
jgi:hypothetical protein